jgi:hypothetical protein
MGCDPLDLPKQNLASSNIGRVDEAREHVGSKVAEGVSLAESPGRPANAFLFGLGLPSR